MRVYASASSAVGFELFASVHVIAAEAVEAYAAMVVRRAIRILIGGLME